MNFDEMDIEPNNEPSAGRESCPKTSKIFSKEEKAEDEELQTQLLDRRVSLADGGSGYVFTCKNNEPTASWRCHVCNFVDTWKRFKTHLDTQWHEDNMSKYHHSRSNFTKVENIIADFSVGQPLPPGMETEVTGPCQILMSLKTYERPLIGLEFLLELQNVFELKEPRYLCLLCDKRGDPRTILVHLTSQNHYMQYLKKYFPKFHSLIDEFPKSYNCRANVSNVTSHLVAKLEEKYGRLQPTATRDDVLDAPELRFMLLQKINSSDHFSESVEDAILEGMLTIEYVQNPQLLPKHFPLKPKHVNIEKPEENSNSLFDKSSKNPAKKNIRGNSDNTKKARTESPDDVIFVACSTNLPARNGHRSRERSPLRSKNRVLRQSRDRSLRRSRDRSLRRSRDRSLRRSGDSSLRRSREKSSFRVDERSPPFRGARRSPLRRRSPFRGRERSLPRLRSRSRHRSRSAERERRRYVSPSHHRTVRSRGSRSRSLRRRSRSPILERVCRRSPSPLDRLRERSPPPSRYGSRHYRSPVEEIRRAIRHPSLSPLSASSDYSGKWGERSRSRERSPFSRARRSRSRSRPRHRADINSASNSLASIDGSSKIQRGERSKPVLNDSYSKEAERLKEKLNKDMDGYMEIPESHPAYQDEWKKFWSAKYKEVQRKGKEDPLKYDYKPEWIVFWNERVKELFDMELKSKMNALKNKYRISDRKKEEKPVERVSLKSPTEDDKKTVLGIKTMWKELTGCEIKDDKTAVERRSLSPWEDDDLSSFEVASKDTNKNNVSSDSTMQPISADSLSPISDTESPQRNPFCRSRSRSRSKSQSVARSTSDEYPFKKDLRKPPSKKIHFDNPLNIITVLRQLSVLEFQLGSHAGHVISLLTSGLAMERIKPQSSIDLLTKENILFLELVKEKLKGQLLAGIVPKAMVKATLFCIKNIDDLLDVVSKLKPSTPPSIPVPPAALLYGTGSDQIGAAQPDALTSGVYGSHLFGPQFGSYNAPFRHFQKGKGGNKRKERNQFRRTSSKQMDDVKGADHSRGNEPTAKPVGAVVEEIPIDKNLIALQIAEVLTQQGRLDVSNEELQTLVKMVVESLKPEQKMRTLQKNSPAQLTDMTMPAIMNALAAISTAPNAELDNAEAPLNPLPAIPTGSNLKDISSKTLALLQDACENASAVPNANKPFTIDDSTEADIIDMLRNFKSLPRMKQEKLIEYLRKLEATDPERVEELKKYVNVL